MHDCTDGRAGSRLLGVVHSPGLLGVAWWLLPGRNVPRPGSIAYYACVVPSAGCCSLAPPPCMAAIALIMSLQPCL